MQITKKGYNCNDPLEFESKSFFIQTLECLVI